MILAFGVLHFRIKNFLFFANRKKIHNVYFRNWQTWKSNFVSNWLNLWLCNDVFVKQKNHESVIIIEDPSHIYIIIELNTQRYLKKKKSDRFNFEQSLRCTYKQCVCYTFGSIQTTDLSFSIFICTFFSQFFIQKKRMESKMLTRCSIWNIKHTM